MYHNISPSVLQLRLFVVYKNQNKGTFLWQCSALLSHNIVDDFAPYLWIQVGPSQGHSEYNKQKAYPSNL
jgi:hypothetical protein